MSTDESRPSAVETFRDELPSHIAASLEDPEYRAASVDIERRLLVLKALADLRRASGLTQSQVARRMGVGQSTISGLETEGSDPRLSTVQRYARAVGAECHVLVKIADHNWAPQQTSEYVERAQSRRSVDVQFSRASEAEKRWAQRVSDFALAG